MRLRLLALALIAASCQDGAGEAWPNTVWDPCARGDAFDVLHGQVRQQRSHWLTVHFGQEDLASDETAPDVLGDTRDALVASTPSRFVVPLQSDQRPRHLRCALRRLPMAPAREHATSLVRCEVFLRRGEELLSLASLELAAPRKDPVLAWEPLRAEIPPGAAGSLEFITRLADPAMAQAGGPEVAWANPTVTRDAPRELPDVLVVSIDTLRADALSHAPALRRWADRGVYWPRAISPSSWTLPSYASLFTGVEAARHGAGRGSFPKEVGGADPRDFRALRPGLPTLAEAFRSAGYRTGMLHQNPFLEPWSGLDRGFGSYRRLRDDPATGVRAAQRWWSAADPRPRLLVLHLMAPHLPYDPPPIAGLSDDLPPDPLAARDYRRFLSGDHTPEERRRFFDLPLQEREAVTRRYRAEVRVLDHFLGPWLDELLSAADAPLVVLHSDHGEELWEQGSFEHGHGFPDAVVEVPLALVWPGRLEAQRRGSPVAVAALAPTILRLAGVAPPPGWEGDLFEPPKLVRSSGTLYRSPVAGRVFHVEAGTSSDLSPGDLEPEWGPPAELGPELRQALSELGYVSND